MKLYRYQLVTIFWMLFLFQASATVLYVDLNSTNPTPPYTSWATAATNIQDAVDVSSDGDQILVTNGLYQIGGRVVYGSLTNRVVINKAVTVQSINGPLVTVIQGNPAPYHTYGDSAVRCAYLTNNARLIGFTLQSGATRYLGDSNKEQTGGGLWCESTSAVVTNCIIANNAATNGGGGASGGTFYNCTFNNNSTPGNGGGVQGANLFNCSLINNYGQGIVCEVQVCYPCGGGAYMCSLSNCVLSGNYAFCGGAARSSTLNYCVVSNNYVTGFGIYGFLTRGGGLDYCTANCCIIRSNSAGCGGGASYGTLNNCLISGNGNGATDGTTLNNCTLVGNSGSEGAGALFGTLNNCIAYYNSGPDYYGSTLNYCCTTLLPTNGVGNFTNAPLFVNVTNDFHLQPGSPCVDAGNNAYVATTTDLDGNPRIFNGVVDLGAYECQTNIPLTVAIQANLTNVPVGYLVSFTGIVSKGRIDSWNFGDGTVVSNQLSVSHSWAAVGDYPVVLTAYDSSHPGGVSATVTIHVKTQIVYYVNQYSRSPMAPYDSWSTAARNIQNAIDVALPVPQSLVLVTNGIYQTGGGIAYGILTNRVMINKPITVQSVNGPSVTVIQGNPVIGDTAVRCAYLTNNAVLTGFTLTAGATRSAGDASHENSGGGVWGESTNAIISNCVLTNNSAVTYGGGAYGGTLNNCIVSSNSATFNAGSGNGGGASSGILNDCVLFNNIAGSTGGGADNCTLTSCALTGNLAQSGAGANNSTLNGCSLTSNQAKGSGGGANLSTLNNCTLTGNSSGTGGGANSCTLNNCIIYYNSAPNEPNYSGATLNYCCTLPLPGNGDGNMTAEPKLTDSAHISADSPCRGAGSTNYVSGMDIDAQAWLNPPSIGCDEFYGGAVTGALSVSAQLSYTNVAVGFTVNCAGTILGHAAVNVWNFGDGTLVTNQISASHAWASSGVYPVVLTAYNSSNPSGVSATNTVYVLNQPIHYVSLSSVNPVSPYLSWATAATNIQDAVDAAYGDAMVLVTNGVYQTGGRIVYGSLSNRVVISKTIAVQSVNGPAVTFIQGYPVPGTTNGDGAVRCVYMTNNTVLSGFTLSNGATRAAGDTVREQSGGGVFCESGSAFISNCVLTANSASDSAGGAYQGTFNNCVLSGNWALSSNWGGFPPGGGGALQATLNNCLLSNNWVVDYPGAGGGASCCMLTNCTLTGNSANFAGGAYYCTLNNSLLYSNQAWYAGGAADGQLNGCILQNNLANEEGGGAYSCGLNNCLLLTNSAGSRGGGVVYCQLNNCTLIGNMASNSGGGADFSLLNNCIAYYNTAPDGMNYSGYSLDHCCTTPLPDGIGNIANEPVFVNPAGGDYHLQSNSPCINAGNNAYVSGTNDFGGNPRIVGGTVDIGAYEFQSPTSVISYAWLQQYGLPTDGTADYADTDGDGFNNWNEWRAGTIPTDPSSLLKMTTVTNDVSGITVTWQSVSGVTYFLQRGTNLTASPVFSTIQTDIAGQPDTTSFTDTDATGNGPYFYRVGVQ